MNLALATKIFNLLKKDPKYQVYITRDSSGYTKDFAEHFELNEEHIDSFIESSKKNILSNLGIGTFIKKANTPHAQASEAAVFKLYAINKWVNKNEIDAVIHVHFNDYRRKTKWRMGDREGFAIYVPDEQFLNSEESFKLGNNIFNELVKKYKTSNYVNELGGMVSDQRLIALGANRTLVAKARTILVEYGYIYKFGNREKRLKDYEQMAELTVAGLNNYYKLSTP